MGVAEIVAFLKALPMLVEELSNLRKTIENVQNARTDMKLAEIKDRLNVLTNQLRTTDDKKELADIVRSLNDI